MSDGLMEENEREENGGGERVEVGRIVVGNSSVC